MSKLAAVVVREYGSPREYSSAVKKMASQGYRVQSSNTIQKRGLINYLLFFWPRKSTIVVTYELVQVKA